MTRIEEGAVSRDSRRAFLGTAGALASTAVVTGGMARAAGPTVQAKRVIVSGGAVRGRKLPNLYKGWVARNFQEIQFNENTHTQTLLNLLGAAARPKPTFQNLLARDEYEFAEMSALFENTGAGAYNGAAPAILDPGVLAQAASIGLVESYQSGFLNTLLDRPIVAEESPVAEALTPDQVNGRLARFIVSLNGGPPPTYSETPSAANDIAILNFALISEYLERDFYNQNLPRFFG